MANIPAAHLLVKATFAVGADEYTSHVQGAKWVPKTPAISITDIGGVTHNFGGSAAYDLQTTLFQDWTATGLTTYLLAHEGETATFTVTYPDQSSFTAEITLVAPEIGGDGNTVPTQSLTFPSTRPVQTILLGA